MQGLYGTCIRPVNPLYLRQYTGCSQWGSCWGIKFSHYVAWVFLSTGPSASDIYIFCETQTKNAKQLRFELRSAGSTVQIFSLVSWPLVHEDISGWNYSSSNWVHLSPLTRRVTLFRNEYYYPLHLSSLWHFKNSGVFLSQRFNNLNNSFAKFTNKYDRLSHKCHKRNDNIFQYTGKFKLWLQTNIRGFA